ncbi:MAG: 2-oxoglutarate dehydrogenase, E2 component, dihydrolipoamide succinyltransferase [Terracidiphilus sp.]|nr:2-oxoglutarate dehydrogenase, E2 component, dihydrolipoamide succinyltransferase [Terracidiphilus sp.]
MPTDVIMPQMGESIFEGTITKWLKKAGDTVEKDEPLFEISTDKVDAEIPSPVAGVLSEIKIPEGATVQVNTVVAVIAASGEAAGTAAPVAAAAPGPGQVKAAPASAPVSGSTDVVMPQLGESIFEGTITKWLKKTGDRVEKDEPLFEISTDKVDAEIPSPVAGVLSEIKIAEGSTVEINTVVAVIGGSASGAGDGASGASASAVAAATATESVPAVSVPAAASLAPGQRLRSSPLVRRIAKEKNINLAQVPGTGSEGRITKEDILRYLSQPRPASVAASASTPVATAASTLPGQLVPLTKMRAIIAQRMLESVQTSPHVHTVFKVDMTRIVRLREREKAQFERHNGVKLTYMPFIAAAIVETLGKFPIVNASLENGSIRYHQNINLGIAVALEWGLIVPVVKQAEELSFLGLARAIADLAERARTKKLKPDEASGSTFTLTNSGIFGDEFSTPIINQPESAILGISGLKKEAVVRTDAEGNDTIAIRSMEHFCLGFDHRLIDGADGCKFMGEFKKTLEGWDRELG